MANLALRFTHDTMPGYGRHRAGRGFTYRLPDGTVLRDAAERSRILSLAIPPAYQSVWICMLANGHLQATGTDERGRKQYRYHPEWHRQSGEKKFQTLPAFAKALPALRRKARAALDRGDLSRERIVAGIVTLLDRTGFRIGNHRYARENRSFGLASLLNRHVVAADGNWRLRFRGKSGKHHDASVDDPRLGALIGELQELPGQYLFCHHDGRQWRPVESGDVNEWIKEAAGGDFSAKQFRTWRATVLCAMELGREQPPEAESARRRAENAAIRTTAEQLNQTLAVCRAYYVHPAVMLAYRSGDLFRAMHSPAPRLRKSDGSADLRSNERRVLRLLEKHGRPMPKRRVSLERRLRKRS